MTRIKTFNQVKKIIQRCTDEDGYVNIKQFAAFITEIRIKINIELQKQKFMGQKKSSLFATIGKSTLKSFTKSAGKQDQQSSFGISSLVAANRRNAE